MILSYPLCKKVEYKLRKYRGRNAYEDHRKRLESKEDNACNACRGESDEHVAHYRLRSCFCVYVRR